VADRGACAAARENSAHRHHRRRADVECFPGYAISTTWKGQNIAFEYRTADGVPERLAEAATDLVHGPVDITATYGTPSSIAARQ
jgi:hypothetical protein